MRYVLAGLILTVLVGCGTSTALASLSYSDREVGALPGLYESYDEAIAYWEAVPGVPSVEEACGSLPIIRVTNTSTKFAAYGIMREKNWPCGIWVEQSWLDQTDSWLPWQRDQERCSIIVHELGHTLSLGHGNYGDEANIMTEPRSNMPHVCYNAYPPPQSFPQQICVPAWAFYAWPEKVVRAYEAGRRQRAWRLFKRWAKHRPKYARSLLRKPWVCYPL